MGAGRHNSGVAKGTGGVCFPDGFQRREIHAVCCGAHTGQNQLKLFLAQQLLSWAHSF